MAFRVWENTLILLLLSTASYAVSGIIEYIQIQHASVVSFYFIWSLGSLCVLPLAARSHMVVKGRTNGIRDWIMAIAGGFFLVGFNIALFLAYRSFLLAAIYPLIALSSMVFFFMDIVRFSRYIRKLTLMIILTGICIVISGVYLVGGGGRIPFDLALLPYVITIPIFTGVGYYLLSYNVPNNGPENKVALMSMISVIISLPLFALFSDFHFDFLNDLLIAASGALYSIAVFLELKAISVNQKTLKSRNVVMRNFVNNFTFLDTVMVLLGSIAIGSYTLMEIAGGALIVLGVVIVSSAGKE